MVRRSLKKPEKVKDTLHKIGNYFLSDDKDISFIKSGCVRLDNILSGGWAQNRIINIVGDQASGKTLLAIEACANFKMQYKQGLIHYLEVEDAFDVGYAEALGMPVSVIQFKQDIDTVEKWYRDVDKLIEERLKKKKNEPLLYILDSLDALTDEAEKERDIGDDSYGTQKAIKMSSMFRQWIHGLGKADITLLIISQVRDKIGVMFGSKKSRSGGKALDFYASQIIELALKKKLDKTFRGEKQVYAMDILAKCTKNKVGISFRTCDFILRIGFGMDCVLSSLFWLKKVKGLKELDIEDDNIKEVAESINETDDIEFKSKIDKTVNKIWIEIQSKFLPKKSKYS